MSLMWHQHSCLLTLYSIRPVLPGLEGLCGPGPMAQQQLLVLKMAYHHSSAERHESLPAASENLSWTIASFTSQVIDNKEVGVCWEQQHNALDGP